MSHRLTHVLLVEDDEIDVMNVQRAFKKNQISNPLHIVNNGLDALNFLRSKLSKFTLNNDFRCVVLLDLNMPQMNGIEFLKSLRSDPDLKSTMVTVLTTSDYREDREKAYEYHVSGYFVKPNMFSDFVDIISTLNRYWTLCEIG